MDEETKTEEHENKTDEARKVLQEEALERKRQFDEYLANGIKTYRCSLVAKAHFSGDGRLQIEFDTVPDP